MEGDHGAAALGDDRRVRHLGVVADVHHPVDDVAGVLAQGVVHRRLEVALAAVVVDAEAAADVEVAQAGAHARQPDVDVGELVDAVLDVLDVVDLAAHVAVQQLEAARHAALLEVLHGVDDLGDGEAELAAVAGRLAPAAGAGGGELDAHAETRLDAVALAVLGDEQQLGEALDDGDDVAAELPRQHRALDVLVVLEAVADDGALALAARQGERREQLGLAAHLEAEAEAGAVAVDLVDDVALLVDLDGKDGVVAAAVAVLADGVLEGLVDLLQAVLEQVGEAQQQRRREAAGVQAVHDLEQVGLRARVLARAHGDVPALVDAEVALAPVVDAVEEAGGVERPLVAVGGSGRGAVGREDGHRARITRGAAGSDRVAPKACLRLRHHSAGRVIRRR